MDQVKEALKTLDGANELVDEFWRKTWGPLRQMVAEDPERAIEVLKSRMRHAVVIECTREALRVVIYLKAKGADVQSLGRDIESGRHRRPFSEWGT